MNTDRMVSLPMFNLLCIRQRIVLLRQALLSQSPTNAAALEQLGNISDLAIEAIVKLEDMEKGD